MRGQYPTHRRFRPHPSGCPGRSAQTPARFFLCARCRTSVLICSHCDRGQIYCAGSCAQDARRQAQGAAGRRYQTTRRGRIAHALRARRYRRRQKNVTHQGSLPRPTDDLLPEGLAAASERPSPGGFTRPPAQRCHRCGCRCPDFVRQDFLRRRWGSRTARRGAEHDRFP